MVSKLLAAWRAEGLNGLVRIAYRKVFKPVLPSFKAHSTLFSGRAGIEIGGPSQIFCVGSLFPVYSLAKSLDQCNFSSRTLWSGQFDENESKLKPPGLPGERLVHEATALSTIADANYDFLLA